MFAITAKKRDSSVKLDVLRKEGEIPAVFYGMGKDTTSISIPVVLFKKLGAKQESLHL
jgi:ribosomal protein L25 (general stress protein Ctc)